MTISFEKNDYAQHSEWKNRLEFVEIKLSWSRRRNFGHEFDLDLSCFLLGESGHIASEKDFVFYNNHVSPCGAVKYGGDDRAGDHEIMEIDFPKLQSHIKRIVVAVSIHDAQTREQNFGIINDARLDIMDRKNGEVLGTCNLSEIFSHESALPVCEFVCVRGDWKLKTLENPKFKNLSDLAQHYGIG